MEELDSPHALSYELRYLNGGIDEHDHFASIPTICGALGELLMEVEIGVGTSCCANSWDDCSDRDFSPNF